MTTRRSKRAPKPKGPSEHQIQVALFDWLAWAYPGVYTYAVPNAAKRSPKLAVYLKKEGLRAGVPDVVICRPAGGYAGMYLELKSENGSVTDEQKKALLKLATEGYAAAVAFDLDTARTLIDTYLRGNWDATQQFVSVH